MKRRMAGALLGAALGCQQAPIADGCLAIDAPLTPTGVDARFQVTVRLTCAGIPRGRVSWRQVDGPPLRELVTSDGGFRLTARAAALRDLIPEPLPWGVIPLSPRTRGEVTLRATWSDGRRTVSRDVRIAAAARSRGLPNLSLGTRVYLGGDGWQVRARPRGSVATLANGAGFASFEPDTAGDFELADDADRTLALRAGRYDETPLDCGRAGCHAAIVEASRDSPMTNVLARGLARIPGQPSPAFGAGYPGCAVACHATGEPGARDGGFTHVAEELGVAHVSGTWHELPRPLRRLGGVGCLACHGPAALPPPSDRANILRAGVCAVCHDAPPRYGHVLAWQGSRMARADRDTQTRTDARCARCHTTSGFLSALSDKPDRESSATRPSDGPAGITCAACHAVHDHGASASPPAGLLRAPSPPALLADVAAAGRSAVCLGCHTPDEDEPRPSATAAALFFGRGGLNPDDGAPLPGAVTHAGVANGCVGCHRTGPADLEHGGGHRFAAGPATCRPCHAGPLPPSDIAERARRLWNRWRSLEQGGSADERPAHADDRPVHAGDARPDRRTRRGRVAWNILLVLEDPAAAAHNAPYARALLAAAERALTSPAGSSQ